MTESPTDNWPTVETLHGGEPPYAPPPPPPPPPPDRRFGAGMLLALAAIALAAAGIAIAYFLTHRDNGSNVTTTVVTTSGTAAAGQPMPKLTGKKLAAARTTLLALGIQPTVTPQTSKQPSGTVLAQAPEAGTTLTRGTPVTLVVARARQQATSTGTTATTSTEATTTAATTTPATTAPTTTASAPPQPRTATVPDVSNQTEAAAVQSLGRQGIIASLAFVPGTDPLGTVEGQAKQAGTTVPYRSHMQINISSGPGDKPKERVPNVIGQTLRDALSSINGANLRLLYLKLPVTSKSQAGKVVQQSPLGGGQAPRNAQVVVYLGAFSG